MNEDQAKRFERQLLALRCELESTADASERAAKPVALDQSSVGRVSRGDAIQSQQLALETNRRRKEQLLAITAALRRIVEGTYGECVTCSDEIDPRRLTANPTAIRCIHCASR